MHILAHTTIPLHEAVWRPLQVRKGKATVFWEVDFLKCVLALESQKNTCGYSIVDFGSQKIAI
jgi:hypothetical protein